MKNKSSFATVAMAVVILISGCALGSSFGTEVADLEHGEHGFIQSPGDYWTPVDLPDMSDEEKREYCEMSSQEWEEYYTEKLEQATQLSDALEEYILDWYYDGADPVIPDGLLPQWINSEKTHDWRLLRPEEVEPENQWYYYPAREEPAGDDFSALYQNNAATHVTYLKLLFIAPFGSQLLVEGDFPHARFMDYQITEPFEPRFPVASNTGVMEIPIVDIDIEPDPGHVNPFRLGADRNAQDRHYHLTFDLTHGNAVDLNPVMQNKYFRAPGNTRVGGPFSSTGPWGDGVLVPSVLWLRYYAPDKGPDGRMDPLAGVSLPRVLLKLKTGETFWIKSDDSLAIERQLTTAPGVETTPQDPPTFLGPSLGWFKMFGHWLMFAEGRGYVETFQNPSLENFFKSNIRNTYRCFFNQGANAPPPGNFTLSATDLPYNNYLSRPHWLGENKVYVMTGRLPTTPRTRDGEPTMEGGQARYWSICHTGDGPENPDPDGAAYHKLGYGCLMDDEITVDENNDYIIVYSRPGDRPVNAQPECGVTWQDFGPDSSQGFILRWMNIYPDHYMEEYAPTDDNIPWETGGWSQDAYDKSLVGENKPGVLGPYHPVIHYLDKGEFEELGCPIDADAIPEWREESIVLLPSIFND
jgi:hypothetical protein